MTSMMASGMTMGALHWYDQVKMAAGEVGHIYQMAYEIDPWVNDRQTYHEHQKNLFANTGRLEGLAQSISEKIRQEIENKNERIHVALDFSQAHERFLFQPKGASP